MSVDKHGRFTRDLWPGDIPVLQGRPEVLTPSEVVPIEFEDLCEWMFVEGRGSNRPIVIICPSSVSEDPFVDTTDPENVELVFRIQGVVEEINLQAIGDWDG